MTTPTEAMALFDELERPVSATSPNVEGNEMSEPKAPPEAGTPAARASLYKRILEVTAAMDRIPKNGRNEFHKYNYATESDIVDGLRGVLLEHGLALLPPSVLTWERTQTTKRDGSAGDDLTRVQMQFELADTESGEVYTACMWGEGMDGGDKGFYKAYTGAVKYFLMKTFLIATGDDPEAAVQQESHRQATPRQLPQQAQRPTTPQVQADREPTLFQKVSAVAKDLEWDNAQLAAWITENNYRVDGAVVPEALAAIEGIRAAEQQAGAQAQAKELFAGAPA